MIDNRAAYLYRRLFGKRVRISERYIIYRNYILIWDCRTDHNITLSDGAYYGSK